MSTLLAEAIRNMSGADLLRAFENPRWGRHARELIRAELLKRLNRYDEAHRLLAVANPGWRDVDSPG